MRKQIQIVMARRRKGRPISGIIILDKPLGRSSNHVLQEVKRLFNAQKAGHTGSLDPLATGLLPICLGEATKVSSYLLDANKSYQVTCQLGLTTDTGDAEGKVMEQQSVPVLEESAVLTLLAGLEGEQDQVPPMYSALKHQGQPLYKLARQGIEIERKARRITIYAIQLDKMTADSLTLTVRCSKGTYIRTLAEEIGHKLGCGAHVSMLRRIEVAGYEMSQSLTLETLHQTAEQGMTALDAHLLATEDALPDWPSRYLNQAQTTYLQQGRLVTLAQEDTAAVQTKVRLFDDKGIFFGLGEIQADQVLAPKRIMVFPCHADEIPVE